MAKGRRETTGDAKKGDFPVKRIEVSKKGATIRVERLELPAHIQQKLSTGVKALNHLRLHADQPADAAQAD